MSKLTPHAALLRETTNYSGDTSTVKYTNVPAGTIKYSDDASTVTIDLRTLASLVPAHFGDIVSIPITIPRNILQEPEPKSEEESESDDEPEIPTKFKKLDRILSNLSFDLERTVSQAYKASAIVRNLIDQEGSSSDSDYASSDENERFLPPPPPLTRQKAIAISSDEEESVTVKDDLPLAPGRYKKQF